MRVFVCLAVLHERLELRHRVLWGATWLEVNSHVAYYLHHFPVFEYGVVSWFHRFRPTTVADLLKHHHLVEGHFEESLRVLHCDNFAEHLEFC